MCGIVGTFNYLDGEIASPYLIEKMCSLIEHRGPDDWGMHMDGALGMGIRRLSIIDVSKGHQPICNEVKKIWVVYNGEIYNFRELKAHLETKGHMFRTRTDTEVVVHAYEEWGLNCFNRLRGIFAFALWDSEQNSLLIARDHLGVKPLYFYDTGRKLIWGSEVKAILVDPDYECRPNLASLGDFLRFRFVPAPNTFFQGIKKLAPGHYLLCRAGSAPVVNQYWDIPLATSNTEGKSVKESAEEFRGHLQEAVNMQLMSDVPLGAFLSGGIDSSAIVGLMSQKMDKPVKTFSVGFGAGKPVDELDYARIVAQHFKTDHHELIVEPTSFELLSEIIWHLDEPIADIAVIPTYLLSHFAKKHVTVVLTGEGADEMLAGYRKYYWNKLVSSFHNLPAALKKIFIEVLKVTPMLATRHRKKLLHWLTVSDKERMIYMMSDLNRAEVLNLISPEAAEVLHSEDHNPFYFNLPNSDTDNLTRMLYLDAKAWLADDLLAKVDKMTMSASLEARVPFLDPNLVEYSMGIPSEFKLKGSIEKHLLKRAIADIVPPSIVKRKKHVFQVPITRWFQGDLRTYLLDILTDQRTINRGFINPASVEKLLNRIQKGEVHLSQQVFSLLVLELWGRVFMDGEGKGSLLR